VRLAGPGEGLLADLLVVLLAWTTAAAVAGSHWVPGSEAVIPVAIVGAIFVAALARLAPRGVTYWLAIEVAMVLLLFLSTARPLWRPRRDRHRLQDLGPINRR